MDFNNHIIMKFDIGGTEIIFSETMRNSVIVSCILVVLALIVNRALKNFTEVPKGFQNAIEMGVEAFSNLVDDSVGKKHSHFGNWYFTVFLYVLVSNYVGLLGLRSPTADLAVTFSLAVVTFVLIHYTGISKKKGEYFKGYLEPIAVFMPVNILSAIATPISLSFRLFGNILGGTIIMGLVYSMPIFIRIGIPAVLHLYFDIFAGAIQALIFTMLGLLFINEQIPEE